MLKHDKTITLRIEDELLKALGRIGQKKDRPLAWLIRDAIKRYIKEEK